jgi:hypothetical protein
MKNTTATKWLLFALGLWLLSQQCAQCFYDPGQQRWINRDPIEERGGENLFRFVRNQPITSVDPEGLEEDASINCWPRQTLDKCPGQGQGRIYTAQAKYANCLSCCEERFPINGGDQQKWQACYNLCGTMKDNYALGAGSTGRDLPPRAPRFPSPSSWLNRLLNSIRNLWK